MKPILYDGNETAFTSNGLGRLDAISCTVTEERNGIYELEMEISTEAKHYADLAANRMICAVPSDGAQMQPFRIYKISEPMDGRVKVYACHLSYDLSYIPVMPFEASSCTQALQRLKLNAAVDCPFEFWSDKSVTGNFKLDAPASLRSKLAGEEGSILDVYGTGEYEFDKYTVKLHLHRGSETAVTLRYGKNITDIEQETNIENTVVGIVPYWTSGSEEDGSSETVTLTSPVVYSSTYRYRYPQMRVIPVDFSSDWQDEPTQAQLKARAEKYITDNEVGIPKVSITVSFAALWQTDEYKNIAPLERVKLCDTVSVIFEKLGINVSAKVVRTEYDVLAERYREVEIGSIHSAFSKSVASSESRVRSDIIKTKSELGKAIDKATSLITGNTGGYVVLHGDEDGYPYEILVMDTPDISTATNVWRFNQAGLGHSGNGYNGPYSLAMTMDGSIVATMITTGTLSANLIKAGLLMDVKEKTWINMETGTFSFAGGQIAFDGTNITLGDKVKLSWSNVSNKPTIVTESRVTEITKSTVTTEYVNALEVVAGSVAAEKITGTTISGKTIDGGTVSGSTITGGSISIGGGVFKVDSSGALTATNASIRGTITAGSTSGYWIKLDTSGKLVGGYGSSQYGYIDYSATMYEISNPSVKYYGIQIQGGMLRIATPAISVYSGTDTSQVSTHCGSGTLSFVSNITNTGSGLSWTTGTIKFINGLMVTTL